MESKNKIRQNQLANIQQFIDTSKGHINRIINELGWLEEKVKEDDILVTCVYNKSHRVSAKNLHEHLTRCGDKALSYSADALHLSEPCDNANSTIRIDDKKKIEIFDNAQEKTADFKSAWNRMHPDPKTSDRLFSTFSRSERLAMYEYATFATKGPTPPPEFMAFTNNSESDKTMTYKECLERERNLKRRRIKYKSVHTNRKSYTEVIREVIENQMELFTDYKAIEIQSKSSSPANYYKTDELRNDQRHKTTDGEKVMGSKLDLRKNGNMHNNETTQKSSRYRESSMHRHRSRERSISKSDRYNTNKHHDREQERHRRSSRSRWSNRRYSEKSYRESRERTPDKNRKYDNKSNIRKD